MKKILVLIAFLFLVPPFAFAAEEQGSNAEADCQRAAQEENVPADELDAYIQNCVREMTSSGDS